MKCETVRIHFLSDIFGPEILLPWQCDAMTSLNYGHFRLGLGNSNLFPRSLVSQIDASNPDLHGQYILME